MPCAAHLDSNEPLAGPVPLRCFRPWPRATPQGRRRGPIGTRSRWRHRPVRRFAKNVRASRSITFVFSCLYGICLAIVLCYPLEGAAWVIVFGSFYIASLFGYRYF